MVNATGFYPAEHSIGSSEMYFMHRFRCVLTSTLTFLGKFGSEPAVEVLGQNL